MIMVKYTEKRETLKYAYLVHKNEAWFLKYFLSSVFSKKK